MSRAPKAISSAPLLGFDLFDVAYFNIYKHARSKSMKKKIIMNNKLMDVRNRVENSYFTVKSLMKIRIIAVIFLFVLNNLIVKSQNKEEDEYSRNVIFIEAGGHGGYGSLNYENVFFF